MRAVANHSRISEAGQLSQSSHGSMPMRFLGQSGKGIAKTLVTLVLVSDF